MLRIAQFDQHLGRIEAQHLTGKLGEDRVGPRTDIGHVRFDDGTAVGFQRNACLGLGDIVDACGARHAGAHPPLALARVARAAGAAVPTECVGPLPEAFGQLVR